MYKLKFVCTLMLALAILSVGASAQKAKKVKDKRFEPVVRANLEDYEGTYIGIEPDYVIEIEVTANGQLKLQSLEDGQSVSLTNVQIKGARLTADKVYADGRKEKFEGTFSNRIMNGVSVFGLVVEGLRIDMAGLSLTRVFYRRS